MESPEDLVLTGQRIARMQRKIIDSNISSSSHSSTPTTSTDESTPPDIKMPLRKRVKKNDERAPVARNTRSMRQPIRSAPIGGGFSRGHRGNSGPPTGAISMNSRFAMIPHVVQSSPRQADVYMSAFDRCAASAEPEDATTDDGVEAFAIEDEAQLEPEQLDGIIRLGDKTYNYKVTVGDDPEEGRAHFNDVMNVIWDNYIADLNTKRPVKVEQKKPTNDKDTPGNDESA